MSVLEHGRGYIGKYAMPPPNDMELLREFVASDAQDAFETLLNRHINLVYSTALRMVRDPSLASEVTQTTFIILAKKARLLGSGTVLSGWLYRTTQFVAARAMRTECRRREREEEAAKMQTSDSNSMWEELSPLLDQAMAQLGETDRNAVVLRYFENKDSRDVGAALGINEAAAQKRVARAVEKMRKFCLKRGIVAPAIALTAVISANAVHAAPTTVVATTAAAAKGVGVAASTSALVKGTLQLMRWIKIKAAVTTAVSAAAVAGAVVFAEAPRWSQPQYGGRILSSWLTRLDDGKHEKEGEMSWVSQDAQSGLSVEQKTAVDAIRAIGPAALPYLHEEMTKEDGKIDKLRAALGLSAPTSGQRYQAMLALEALGPEAKPLLPQLTECLEGTNCPKAAAAVLASIGPEGWAVLTREITKPGYNTAACSVWALAIHRAGGPEAVAALKAVVAKAAPDELDVEAVWALAEISPDHKELVPLFINGLASKHTDMRWACALALAELGEDARPAIPALEANLNDVNSKVRHDAAQALQAIDMNEAVRAGAGEPLTHRHIARTMIY